MKKISSLVPANFRFILQYPTVFGNDLKKTTAEQITERVKMLLELNMSYPDMMRTLEYLEIRTFSASRCDKMLQNCC